MNQQDETPATAAIRTALEQAQWEILNKEKQEVLSQPHRAGSTSQLRENALGRFVEDFACGSECYEAGRQYILLVYRYRLAMGIPGVPIWVRQEYGGSGAEMDPDKLQQFVEEIREWKETIDRCEDAMRTAGEQTFAVVQEMIFKDIDPPIAMRMPVKIALLELAVESGKIWL